MPNGNNPGQSSNNDLERRITELTKMFKDVNFALDNINKKIELISEKQQYEIANIEERQQYLNFVNLIFDVQEYAVIKAIDKFRDVLEYEKKNSDNEYAILFILFEIAAPIAVSYIFKGVAKLLQMNGVMNAEEAQETAGNLLKGLRAKIETSNQNINILSNRISNGVRSIKLKEKTLSRINSIVSSVEGNGNGGSSRAEVGKMLKGLGVDVSKELKSRIDLEKKELKYMVSERSMLQKLTFRDAEQSSFLAEVIRVNKKNASNTGNELSWVTFSSEIMAGVVSKAKDISSEMSGGPSNVNSCMVDGKPPDATSGVAEREKHDLISSTVTLYRKTVLDDMLRAKAEVIKRVSVRDYLYSDVCEICDDIVPIMELVNGSLDVAMISNQIASYHLLLMLAFHSVSKEPHDCQMKSERDPGGPSFLVIDPHRCGERSVVNLSEETLRALSNEVYVIPHITIDSELRPSIDANKSKVFGYEEPKTYSDVYRDNGSRKLKESLLELNKMMNEKVCGATK